MGPPRRTGKNSSLFYICFGPWKNAWGGPKWDREGLFPANPDLADILGRMDLDFENFVFWIFWNPDFWISRSPDLKIPRFLDFQVPALPFLVRMGPFTNLLVIVSFRYFEESGRLD